MAQLERIQEERMTKNYEANLFTFGMTNSDANKAETSSTLSRMRLQSFEEENPLLGKRKSQLSKESTLRKEVPLIKRPKRIDTGPSSSSYSDHLEEEEFTSVLNVNGEHIPIQGKTAGFSQQLTVHSDATRAANHFVQTSETAQDYQPATLNDFEPYGGGSNLPYCESSVDMNVEIIQDPFHSWNLSSQQKIDRTLDIKLPGENSQDSGSQPMIQEIVGHPPTDASKMALEFCQKKEDLVIDRELEFQFEQSMSASYLESDSRSRSGRKLNDSKMEKSVLNWIHSYHLVHNRIPSGDLIKKKALELSAYSDFKASKGWLDKFMKRNQGLLSKMGKEVSVSSVSLSREKSYYSREQSSFESSQDQVSVLTRKSSVVNSYRESLGLRSLRGLPSTNLDVIDLEQPPKKLLKMN